MSIRLADEADAPPIRTIYAPLVENTIVSFEDEPPSEEAMADRITDTLTRYPWLVCEIESEQAGCEDEVTGYAYAGQHRKRGAYRWSVDVSVYVAEDHRRAGVATGLYESLFALLRLQRFYNAFAGIALPNEASVTLHESLGFDPVGVYESVGYKHGAWRDVGWWQLALQGRPDDSGIDDSKQSDGNTPEEPRPLPDVEGTTAFENALSVGESSIES